MVSQISLIGTGRMCSGLGRGWAAAGLSVIFGSRRPEERQTLEREIPGSRVTTYEEAAGASDVVLIGLPYPEVHRCCRDTAVHMGSRLVIDITNPFSHRPPDGRAGAEVTADTLGNRRVIAAFKTNFAPTLAKPVHPRTGERRHVYFAGGSRDDKQTMTELIECLGFRPIDCGSLEHARALDLMVPLMIELDGRYADGNRETSFQLLAR